MAVAVAVVDTRATRHLELVVLAAAAMVPHKICTAESQELTAVVAAAVERLQMVTSGDTAVWVVLE
jgi:hypothetical protein